MNIGENPGICRATSNNQPVECLYEEAGTGKVVSDDKNIAPPKKTAEVILGKSRWSDQFSANMPNVCFRGDVRGASRIGEKLLHQTGEQAGVFSFTPRGKLDPVIGFYDGQVHELAPCGANTNYERVRGDGQFEAMVRKYLEVSPDTKLSLEGSGPRGTPNSEVTLTWEEVDSGRTPNTITATFKFDETGEKVRLLTAKGEIGC